MVAGYESFVEVAFIVLAFLTVCSTSDYTEDAVARCWIPVYATIVIAADIAITTTTIKSSTIVNPLCLFAHLIVIILARPLCRTKQYLITPIKTLALKE